MPNGDPTWGERELPELEKFFGKIANVLEEFAGKYNLMIDKYYHQSPAWYFRFRHPVDGVGQIEVVKNEDNSLNICAGWWVDYYDTTRRDLKSSGIIKISTNHVILRKTLEEMLRLVFSWKKSDLERGIENPYRERGVMDNRADLEREIEKYPIPKIN